jgi:PAS domain S-box-containing protein
VPLRDAQGQITGLVGISRDTTKHKHTEALMRLRGTALDAAANAIVITDINGLIEWTNPAFCTLTGYSAEEALARNPRELVKSGRQDDAFYKDMWATILAGKVWRGEMVNRRKDDSLYTESQTVTPVRDETGKISHFVAIKEDISDRKKAESRIRYLNRIYATLSAINKALVRQSSILDAFKSACRIIVETGGFRFAWIGMLDKGSNALRAVAHGGAGDGAVEKLPFATGGNLSEAGIAPEARRMLVSVICNDIEHDPRMGPSKVEALRLGYRSMALLPLYLGGNPCGTLNIYSEEAHSFSEDEINLLNEIASDLSYSIAVSENELIRNKAETRIREQAEVLNLAPAAIMIFDHDHKVTYCNDFAAQLYFRKKPDSVMGCVAEDLFTSEGNRIFEAGRKATLATGSWRGGVTLPQPDGQAVVLEVIMKLVRDNAGRPTARLSIAIDVTEKRRYEEQALRAQRLENLGTLAAGIAHDFNNALAPIIMVAPLLRTMVSDPDAQKMLNIVDLSSARSAALIRQMLSFARGTSGEMRLTQIRHVLREVLDLSQSSFPKSVRVDKNLATDLLPVLGDPTQLHQVFLNLCVNARDAMPEGGALTVSAENCALDEAQAAKIEGGRPGDFVKVEVRDTGTGIPPEVMGRIFEPFFTTKGEGKGTGLGLSTVRGILSRHDGFVTVKTSTAMGRQRGTTFTVYLPSAPGETASSSRTSADILRRGRGELILFVDDEESVREVGAKILVEYGGYRAVTAGNGTEAIATFALRASEVRLLVTDLDMPVLGGQELAVALRKIKPALPVVVMTGGTLQNDKTVSVLANAFLCKPFDAQTLLDLVRRTLDEAGSVSPFPPTS